MVADEPGVDELALEELPHELVEQASRGSRGGALDPSVDADFIQKSTGRLGLILSGELDVSTKSFLESREHTDATPGRGEVDLDGFFLGAVGVVADDVTSSVDLLDLLRRFFLEGWSRRREEEEKER